MRGLVAAALLLMATEGVNAQEARTQVTYKIAMPAETVDAALTAFAGVCRPLVDKYWGDVVSAEAVVQEPMKRRAAELGSTKLVEYIVTVGDAPKAIAKVSAGRFPFAGQKCSFELYGGRQPRVEVAKRVCKALCGLDPETNGSADAVIPVPGLAIIER